MTQRRRFIQQVSALAGASVLPTLPFVGISHAQAQSQTDKLAPPPDLFSAKILDAEFWEKPRTLHMVRPQTGEVVKRLYWKDGDIIDAAYDEICHILRDVNGRKIAEMDPQLLEVLWATQAFIAKFGMTHPMEILSGYRTEASNKRLIESGIPAARKSLHIQAKAADIRIDGLKESVLGELIQSFQQGGVGFYFRQTQKGGWIHADTGLARTWKG